MNYYEIGQRIRKFRKANGLSQEQLAEKIGISTPHMSHIETGNTKLSLPVLVDLAVALGVGADDLLFDGPKKSHAELTAELGALLHDCSTRQLQFFLDLLTAAKGSMNKYLT